MDSTTTIQEQTQRLKVLDRFARMYSPMVGSGVMEYLGTTGLDSLKGCGYPEGSATEAYLDSEVSRHPDCPQAARRVAQVHLADLGSRIFYCDHGSFDTHASQNLAMATCGRR